MHTRCGALYQYERQHDLRSQQFSTWHLVLLNLAVVLVIGTGEVWQKGCRAWWFNIQDLGFVVRGFDDLCLVHAKPSKLSDESLHPEFFKPSGSQNASLSGGGFRHTDQRIPTHRQALKARLPVSATVVTVVTSWVAAFCRHGAKNNSLWQSL